MSEPISAADPHQRRRASVLDTEMAYVSTGAGTPVVFLHGNPTSSTSAMPKLFVNAEPGSILTGAPREFCRAWPNQQEVTVGGSHFVQEDSPAEIGRAIAAFLRGIP